MDKGSGEVKRSFDWLPAHMPAVARLVKEARRTMGSDHVNECWTRGVLKLEPGWFFAGEGPLTVGTPWDDPQMANFAATQVTATQGLLCIKKVDADGKG
jgi:hypothetical protein